MTNSTIELTSLSTQNSSRILGAVGTGKTEELINRITTAIEEGISPQDIAVFCASGNAVTAFRTRLAQRLGDKHSTIRVTTAFDFALEILKTPEALKITGRKAQLLSNLESKFFMEDMKVSGLRSKRIREMLKFFYRSWTELADADEEWLISEEERNMHSLVKNTLAFDEGMLDSEVSNLAFSYLRQDSKALENWLIPHVFVDDYQNLNRASQLITNCIAELAITIAGDKNGGIEVLDPYPYDGGLDEFLDINSEADDIELEICHLASAICSTSATLLEDECFEASQPSRVPEDALYGNLSSHSYVSIEEEFEGVAELVTERIQSGYKPGDIYVVVPNKLWNSRISASIKERGHNVDALPASQILGGDIRDLEKSTPARVYTALKLVSDPSNALAWRSWCGYGDYLSNSSLFSNLYSFAKEEGLDLVAALDVISHNPRLLDGSTKVVDAYIKGKEMIDTVEQYCGKLLLEAITAFVSSDTTANIPSAIRRLCEPIQESDSASALITRAEKNLLNPLLSNAEDAVKVGPAEQLCGLSPQSLLYTGFVNGFIPSRDYFDGTVTTLEKQEKMHADDTRGLYVALGKAQEDLVFTYFTRADLESAEVLKLEIERIRLEDGKRICIISPSEFLPLIEGED